MTATSRFKLEPPWIDIEMSDGEVRDIDSDCDPVNALFEPGHQDADPEAAMRCPQGVIGPDGGRRD